MLLCLKEELRCARACCKVQHHLLVYHEVGSGACVVEKWQKMYGWCKVLCMLPVLSCLLYNPYLWFVHREASPIIEREMHGCVDTYSDVFLWGICTRMLSLQR